MSAADTLARKHCTPCEGHVAPLPPETVADLAAGVPAWSVVGGTRLRREWTVKDFVAGLEFFRRVGELAEAEGHHPDLHLTEYKHVAVEIWTHAAGGLTENDFILAAKIDRVPVGAAG